MFLFPLLFCAVYFLSYKFRMCSANDLLTMPASVSVKKWFDALVGRLFEKSKGGSINTIHFIT